MSERTTRSDRADDSHEPDEVVRLAEMYCQGLLTGEEKTRFEELLSASEQARLKYLSYMSIHARLMELNRPVGRQSAAARMRGDPAPTIFSGVFRGVPVSAVAAAGLVILALVSGGTWYYAKSRGGNLANQVAAGQRAMLAEVTNSLGVVTVEPDATLASQFRAGQPIALKSGLVELRLDTGPVLLLEGPASFQLDEDGSATLASGKLLVDTKGAKLVVNTFGVRAINTGTRYGLNSTGDSLAVHVFEGTVQLEGANDDDFAMQLTEGNAAEIVRRGTRLGSRSIEARPDAFIQSFGNLTGYYRWLVQRDVFASDPDLVCYYSFDEKSLADGRIANRASLTGAALDLVVPAANGDEGPYWVDGRWPQKGALEFTGNDQPVLLPADPRLAIDDDLTVTWWMNANQVQVRELRIVVVSRGANGESRAANFLYSFGFSSGAYLAMHESGDGKDHTFCPVALVDHSRWAHVAFVRDSVIKTYTIYANGKMVTQSPYEANPDGGDSPEVRTAIAQAGSKRTEQFQGTVDEVMIFRRALAADEVSTIYEAGRP
jgi:hypothetical protein